MSGAQTFRWPRAALTADYWRGGLGFGLSLLFLILVPFGSIAFVILAVLTGVFGLYLFQVLTRGRSAYILDDNGLTIATWNGARTVAWTALDGFELRYYSLRRDRESGWMDLKLTAGTTRISFDDRIDGFEAIVGRAFEAARAREVGLSDATLSNLGAMGFVPKARA